MVHVCRGLYSYFHALYNQESAEVLLATTGQCIVTAVADSSSRFVTIGQGTCCSFYM